MRILHLDSGTEMRGGQWQALYLMEGLAGRKDQSILLAPAGAPLYNRARREGIETAPLNAANLFRFSRHSDLVHAHDARAHTLAALLSPAPFVVSRRVAFPVRRTMPSVWKYSRARHYIAISREVQRQLVDAGVAQDRISVVYDGVGLSTSWGFQPGGAVVALAMNDPLKGGARIGEAARMAGIEIHWSSDLAADLARARLFVYITDCEGLGSAVLMAMAYGVPVVASAVGGLPEIVLDGETGFLTGNRPEEIAATIKRSLGNEALTRDCARRAREMVEKRFSLQAMVAGTRAVYERIAQC